MSVNNYALELKNVSKDYPGVLALDGVDLKVKQGSIHGFLGPNGSGKSTAMNIIAGLIPATSGEVFVLGERGDGASLLAKTQIGLLPEHPPLYLNMKVESYLLFSQEIHGHRNREHLDYIIEKLDLEKVRHRLVGNLSKGYRQRVAMAQALIYQAKIIILDEPMVGLDPEAISHMRDLILTLRGEHTILLSTHQLYEAAKICDEVTIIQDGKVKQTGTIEELREKMGSVKKYMCLFSGNDKELEQKFAQEENLHIEALEEQGQYYRVYVKALGTEDMRAQTSRVIVSCGELLEFRQEDIDLEKIFKDVIHDKL